VNWNDLTDKTTEPAINLYPAQDFIKLWKKNWQNENIMWLPFISSCCALEANISEYDLDRPKFENAKMTSILELNQHETEQGPMVIIFSGTLTHRLMSRLHVLKKNIGESYVCMMLGGCALGNGPYQNYVNVLSGSNLPLRVDVFVPGCPPTTEAINEGMITLEQKLARLMETLTTKVKQ
jgi:NADH:ubiquinone oxidoreductase subunit B-like Fe-S oxidoreductase